MQTADPRFARAVVAMSYLLGERGEALEAKALEPSARALCRLLASTDQGSRVAALAREIAHIALALDHGGL